MIYRILYKYGKLNEQDFFYDVTASKQGIIVLSEK